MCALEGDDKTMVEDSHYSFLRCTVLLLLVSQRHVHDAHHLLPDNRPVDRLVNLLQVLLAISFTDGNNQSAARL